MAKERAGDGSALQPMRWWHSLYRSLLGTEHGGARWDVDVDFFDWDEKIVLYRDGRQHRIRYGTSRFDLDDGARIEVETSTYGLRRAHLVLPDGADRQLEPAPGTGERWRANLERDHPRFSRRLGLLSWTVLVIALVLQVPQLVELGAELSGGYEFTSLITLPGQVNTALTFAGVLAGIERALRLRYHWLLD